MPGTIMGGRRRGFTWRGVTPRSAESRWRMSCDGNFSKANTCSSTTKTGREMFQRGALMSRFAGSEGAAKRGESGSVDERREELCIPAPDANFPKLFGPLVRTRAPLPHSPNPPPLSAPLPPQPGGAMNWATAVTSIGLRDIWRQGTRRSARVVRGGGATISQEVVVPGLSPFSEKSRLYMNIYPPLRKHSEI